MLASIVTTTQKSAKTQQCTTGMLPRCSKNAMRIVVTTIGHARRFFLSSKMVARCLLSKTVQEIALTLNLCCSPSVIPAVSSLHLFSVSLTVLLVSLIIACAVFTICKINVRAGSGGSGLCQIDYGEMICSDPTTFESSALTVFDIYSHSYSAYDSYSYSHRMVDYLTCEAALQALHLAASFAGNDLKFDDCSFDDALFGIPEFYIAQMLGTLCCSGGQGVCPTGMCATCDSCDYCESGADGTCSDSCPQPHYEEWCDPNLHDETSCIRDHCDTSAGYDSFVFCDDVSTNDCLSACEDESFGWYSAVIDYCESGFYSHSYSDLQQYDIGDHGWCTDDSTDELDYWMYLPCSSSGPATPRDCWDKCTTKFGEHRIVAVEFWLSPYGADCYCHESCACVEDEADSAIFDPETAFEFYYYSSMYSLSDKESISQLMLQQMNRRYTSDKSQMNKSKRHRLMIGQSTTSSKRTWLNGISRHGSSAPSNLRIQHRCSVSLERRSLNNHRVHLTSAQPHAMTTLTSRAALRCTATVILQPSWSRHRRQSPLMTRAEVAQALRCKLP